jgi:abortive infection bacteriophage resistance protein
MGTLRLYTKQALSISEQINLLRNRGLIIADESRAAKFLGEVSYFRFVQYLRPMEADKVTHQFKQNSRFDDAVGLYEFDSELRDLMFRAVQRIEIALRTKIIHEFSMEHGPFWFFNIALADDERKFIENMNAVDRELSRSKEDFIKEHSQKYDKPTSRPFLLHGKLLNWLLLVLFQNCTITSAIRRQRNVLPDNSIFRNMKFWKVGCAV